MEKIKQCPYCSEEIKATAIKCKHCGSILTESGGLLPAGDGKTYLDAALASKYELLEEVGRGGMAVVYKARQKNLDRVIALKILPHQFTHDKEFLERFHREAREAAKLNHPNIVTIFDEGIENNVHFIAMEFLDGNNLHMRIRQNGKLNVEQTLAVLTPIAEALAYAHHNNVVHRDVKTANIIVTTSGRSVLTDFGLAYAAAGTKLTRTGTVIGTPEYMSPEQADGRPLDWRSDIFSFGIVLYECLTGMVPFSGDNPLTTIFKILNETEKPIIQVNKSVPVWLSSVINQILAKNPQERTTTPTQLVESLKHHSPILKTKQRTLGPVSSQKIIEVNRFNKDRMGKMPKTWLNIRMLSITIGVTIIILIGILLVIILKKDDTVTLSDSLVGKPLLKIDEDALESLPDIEQARIRHLLENADELYVNSQFVEPSGRNALESYHDILRQFPDNPTAKGRIDLIRKSFITAARKEIEAGNQSEANKIINNGLKYFPNDAELTATESYSKSTSLIKQAEEILSLKELSISDLENVCRIGREIKQNDPNNSNSTDFLSKANEYYTTFTTEFYNKKDWVSAIDWYKSASSMFPEQKEFAVKLQESQHNLAAIQRQQSIEKTIRNAEQSMSNHRWDEALSSYNEALRFSSGEPRALKGKNSIPDAIVKYADDLFSEGSYNQAADEYSKALRYRPNDRVLKLKLAKAKEKD
jgi:serine/threonine protein kinase